MQTTSVTTPHLENPVIPRREFNLIFRPNSHGLAKHVQMLASCVESVVEFALADDAKRVVDVWDGHDFVQQVVPRV